MKRSISLIVLCIATFALNNSTAFAQRIWGNPVGQYAYNPSGANVNDMGEILVSYYKNYVSAINAPQGALLMGSTSLPFDNMGAGMRFTYETGGVLNNIMAEGTYVYKINIGSSNKLAFGLSGTYNQTSIDNEKVNAQHPMDPMLLIGAEADYWFDVNVGISIYQPNHYYLGIAGYNLIGNKTSWKIENFDPRQARQFTASGMYTLNLLNGDFKLEASANGLIYSPQDSTTVVYDANLRAIIRKTFWLGGGLATNMVKAFGGIYIQNLSIGYACGFGRGEITDYAYRLPRHELLCRLELNTSKKSKNKRK